MRNDGKNLDRLRAKLQKVRRDAVETRKEVEKAKGVLYGTTSNLNSRQESGGGTS